MSKIYSNSPRIGQDPATAVHSSIQRWGKNRNTAQNIPSVRSGLDQKTPLTSPDNSTLVAAYLAGDAHAFDLLFHRYSYRLLAFIHRIIGDREKSEDLVQEAFVRVHRHLHRFDHTRQFSTWIYTIAANLAKNELRNRSRTPLFFYQSASRNDNEDCPALQFEDRGSRPDSLYARRYLANAVTESIAKLSDLHREVFVLRELEGRSYEDIATITGCNLGTVKSRLNRARQSFATLIEPSLD